MSKSNKYNPEITAHQESPAKPIMVCVNNSFAREEERFRKLLEEIQEMAEVIDSLAKSKNALFH